MVARIVVVCGGVDITGPLAQFLHISGPKCPIPPSKPPSPTAGAGAQKRKAEDLLEADTVARGRHGTALATQGAAEYELIWLLQQRLRAVSMASLALALHASATARPRHGSCQTLITLTRRPLSVSRVLHVLSSCAQTSVLGF